MASTTPKAETFPHFLDLPKEIRLIIWESTYPRNRIIQIISTVFNRETLRWGTDISGTHWTISGTPLVALLVCNESRDLAKDRYKPLSECLAKGPPKDVDLHPVVRRGLLDIRIDLEYDTIMLGPAHMTYISRHLSFENIKHLALMSYEEFMGTNITLSGMLRKTPFWTGEEGCWTDTWPNLRSLNFVLGRTSLIPQEGNREWQPKFGLVDVDSNFGDWVAWAKQTCPKDETGAPQWTTLQNCCSIEADLRRSYQGEKAAIKKAKKWDNLEFRVTVAVHNFSPFEWDWNVCFRRSCSDRKNIPRGEGIRVIEDTEAGLFYWQKRQAICYPNRELHSRYYGIQMLFEE